MQLELNFRPTIQIITALRNTVMHLYEKVLADSDASARLALATHELLENTLRHSIDGSATLQITVEATPQLDAPPASIGRRVVIETHNRATPAKIDSLTAQAAEMSGSDAQTYLIELMGRCAERDEDGGLGLARIRAEAEMEIVVKANGDAVTIVASMTDLGVAA